MPLLNLCCWNNSFYRQQLSVYNSRQSAVETIGTLFLRDTAKIQSSFILLLCGPSEAKETGADLRPLPLLLPRPLLDEDKGEAASFDPEGGGDALCFLTESVAGSEVLSK